MNNKFLEKIALLQGVTKAWVTNTLPKVSNTSIASVASQKNLQGPKFKESINKIKQLGSYRDSGVSKGSIMNNLNKPLTSGSQLGSMIAKSNNNL